MKSNSFKIVFFSISVFVLVSCGTNQDNAIRLGSNNDDNNSYLDSIKIWHNIKSPTIEYKDNYTYELPYEFFMAYNNIQESYETIIQIHRSYNEPSRELVEVFEIGKDIILGKGNYKSILISKQINKIDNFPPLLKIHFIKSTDNDKIIQYSDFNILDNSEYNNINRVFRNILFIFLTLVKITNTR